MVNKLAENTIYDIGDNVRLLFGAYAGKTGTVMRVYPYNKDQGLSDALVMVRFVKGGNNACYMSNLEKVEDAPPNNNSAPLSGEGSKSEEINECS